MRIDPPKPSSSCVGVTARHYHGIRGVPLIEAWLMKKEDKTLRL